MAANLLRAESYRADFTAEFYLHIGTTVFYLMVDEAKQMEGITLSKNGGLRH